MAKYRVRVCREDKSGQSHGNIFPSGRLQPNQNALVCFIVVTADESEDMGIQHVSWEEK